MCENSHCRNNRCVQYSIYSFKNSLVNYDPINQQNKKYYEVFIVKKSEQFGCSLRLIWGVSGRRNFQRGTGNLQNQKIHNNFYEYSINKLSLQDHFKYLKYILQKKTFFLIILKHLMCVNIKKLERK
eukprot:TRINITY_DN9791_c0_g2_i1.p4 TRINITY_DN9791_c0_g2~~TRINITY_DN9791_c0_g2_i1.p4  ORF type:complete len:127 (+),score=0.34 TRINITY_DN9791_c0_g2_i1:323-703(+)